MRIDYTELEREKMARIEAQLTVSQIQITALVTERAALFDTILKRGKVNIEKDRDKATFYADHADIAEDGKK